MKGKKITALMLIMSLIGLNFLPLQALAIDDSGNIKKEKKVKKSKNQDLTYRYEYVNLQWWKTFDDAILEGYVLKAIDNNQDLKIATLKVEEARQQVKLQFSKELPSLTTGIAPGVMKLPIVDETKWVVGVPVIANYEADLFLKNRDKTKAVKKIYEASKLNEQSAYIAVVSAVGATYFNIIKLDKLISIQEELISKRKKIYELMSERNKIGITSTADVVKAEKVYILAETDLIDLQKTRDVLLNNLAVLIGESPNNVNDLKRISYEDLKYKQNIPEFISSEIITNRPDYKVSEKLVEKAGIDVRVAKKEFLPNINILGLMSFSAMSGMSMNWSNALAAALANVMLPIYTGGARIANLKLSKNKYEQILQNYYKTNLVAIKEVNDSLSTLKLDNDKYSKNLKTLNMEIKEFGYTKMKYNQGIISYLDMIQREETLLVMRKMVVNSKIDCCINKISLYKSTAAQNL